MNLALITDAARDTLVRKHGEEAAQRGLALMAAGKCPRCVFRFDEEPQQATVAGIHDPHNRWPTGPCPSADCQRCADELIARDLFEPLDGAR